MGEDNKLRDRFWSELASTRTGMLGLIGDADGHFRPMTAHFEGDDGPLWFFSPPGTPLTAAGADRTRAAFHYAAGGHDLYAAVEGELSVSDDAAAKQRFWTDEVAKWFPDGPDSPSVVLLKFEPDEAQVWLPAESQDHTDVRFGGRPKDERASVSL